MMRMAYLLLTCTVMVMGKGNLNHLINKLNMYLAVDQLLRIFFIFADT